MTTFEDEINRNGRLIFTNVGDSMQPLIRQGRDLLIIEKPEGRLKKYDVPLYKRDSGKYVLHRIMKVRKDDYVICGDNRYRMEYGITDRNIIGVLTAVVRNGRELHVTDIRYRIYVHLWCDLFPLRVCLLRSKKIFERLKKYEKK